MAKSKSKPPSSNDRKRKGSVLSSTLVLKIVSAIIVAVIAWWTALGRSNGLSNDTATSQVDRGVGPNTMAGYAPLINRLMELLSEVDALKGDDNRDQRLATSARVEQELRKIESEIDASTAEGKQGVALVGLVRSALQSDRDGVEHVGAEWNEDALLKKHGLVTYASREYWDEAYSGKKYGDSYDWYNSWDTPDVKGNILGNYLRPLLTKNDRILMNGCGNSNMSALMYAEGYDKIVNVDVADVVISQMRETYAAFDKMAWHTMDAAALSFDSGSFDVVLEKGLFDALYAGTGAQVGPVLAEAVRVLRPGGRFITVTFGEDRDEKLVALSMESDKLPLQCERVGHLETTGKGVFIFSCAKPTES